VATAAAWVTNDGAAGDGVIVNDNGIVGRAWGADIIISVICPPNGSNGEVGTVIPAPVKLPRLLAVPLRSNGGVTVPSLTTEPGRDRVICNILDDPFIGAVTIL
jgi:hypothetical protein